MNIEENDNGNVRKPNSALDYAYCLGLLIPGLHFMSLDSRKFLRWMQNRWRIYIAHYTQSPDDQVVQVTDSRLAPNCRMVRLDDIPQE